MQGVSTAKLRDELISREKDEHKAEFGQVFDKIASCFGENVPYQQSLHVREAVKEHMRRKNPADLGNIIFLGAPGVGKSTVANECLPKRVVTEDNKESKFMVTNSPVTLCTEILRLPSYIEGWSIVDCPGLFDIYETRTALHENLLRNSFPSLVKMIFVLAPRGGRLNMDDVAVMKAVMRALGPQVSYGALINCWPALGPDYKARFLELLQTRLLEDPPVPFPQRIAFVERDAVSQSPVRQVQPSCRVF
jgi:hypothetical protein